MREERPAGKEPQAQARRLPLRLATAVVAARKGSVGDSCQAVPEISKRVAQPCGSKAPLRPTKSS